jgi:hypothetical protein
VDATTGQKLLQRVRAYPSSGDTEEGSLHVVTARLRKKE